MVEEIVLGTRGSDLALAQTKLVSEALEKARPGVRLMPSIIRTSGDEGGLEKASAPAGRKGLFTAEIEGALLSGRIDAAVHSAKDLPSTLAEGTEIAAVLPRGPVYDVMVSLGDARLENLPRGGTIATGSIRRRCQVLWQRPDLQVPEMRGNVPTRLRKLAGNDWAGLILAAAGLERLGLSSGAGEVVFDGRRHAVAPLDPSIFLPAGGQGIIAVQVRAGDRRVNEIVAAADDATTHACLQAERSFLRMLQVDCNCPVGVYAEVEGNLMRIRGQLFEEETAAPKQASLAGPASDPEAMALKLFEQFHD